MIQELIDAIEDICKYHDEITEETLFMDDIKVDSIDVTELIIVLEDLFDIVIPFDDIETFETVGEANEYLENNLGE